MNDFVREPFPCVNIYYSEARHYLLAHSHNLVMKSNSLNYFYLGQLCQDVLLGWLSQLSEFNITIFTPTGLQQFFHSSRRQGKNSVICSWWHQCFSAFQARVPLFKYETEYEALFIALIFVLQIGVHRLCVQGNSMLIIKQVNRKFTLNKEDVSSYCKEDVSSYCNRFVSYWFIWLARLVKLHFLMFE